MTALNLDFARLARAVVGLAGLWMAAVGLIPTATAASPAPESELRFVLVLSRHGVRAPLDTQQGFEKFATKAWPKWSTPPGELTPHGRQQMLLMGGYYRARLIQDGLLSGQVDHDVPLVFLRANNEQRTIATARALGEGLLPGVKVEVQARPNGETDPLFRPAKIPVGHPDRALAVAAVEGRLGGDLRRVEGAHHAAFDILERILVGESGQVPAGKTALLDLPAAVVPGEGEFLVGVRGPLGTAGSITDLLMLQYSEGLPLADVGWGRATPARLTELLTVHALWFDLIDGTSYLAQVQASNLVAHLNYTLQQAATGKADPRAFGAPGQKVVILAGHDSTISCVGGLLGLNWWLPGTDRNPLLLGGALVFELRERRADHQLVVRVSYVSQTLDQTRTLAPLSLDHPPAIAPIFVSGCSEATAYFDAPLSAFAALLQRVVDPHFVTIEP